jgi:hypothetical protein
LRPSPEKKKSSTTIHKGTGLRYNI